MMVREIRAVWNAAGLAKAPSTEPTDGEWDQIRATMYRALRPFDEARRAVWDALKALGQSGELCPS